MPNLNVLFKKLLRPSFYFENIQYEFHLYQFLPEYAQRLSHITGVNAYNFQKNTTIESRNTFHQKIKLWWQPSFFLRYDLFENISLKRQHSFFMGNESVWIASTPVETVNRSYKYWLTDSKPCSSEGFFWENRINFEISQYILSSEVVNPTYIFASHETTYKRDDTFLGRKVSVFQSHPISSEESDMYCLMPDPPGDDFWFLGDKYVLFVDNATGLLIKYRVYYKNVLLAYGFVKDLHINIPFDFDRLKIVGKE